jgi:2-oxoglutarate dehydrogenase E1 component
VRRDVRKPLVVITPKSLLRARQSRSAAEEFVSGHFHEVVDEQVTDPSAVRRIILATGKVAFDAMARRDQLGAPVAVVRIEQLYPWPEEQLAAVVARYEHAGQVVWLQEEPENMGAWTFVSDRLPRVLGDDYELRHVSRVESGSPASGSKTLHDLEQNDLMERAFSD